jgi:ubiquinone/menaquinone biosynthesis C-methylase UbiE
MRALVRFLGTVWLLALLAGAARPQHTHAGGTARPPDRDRDRLYWQLPERLMDEAGIRPGLTVADVGAGDGYFTFRLARRVGPAGRVFATDIDDKALQAIRDGLSTQGVANVTVVLGAPADVRLPEGRIDVALMVNVLHLVKEPAPFLASVARSLKPGGTLVVVGWDAHKMAPELPGWGADRERHTLRAYLRTLYGAGFEVVAVKDFLPMQHMLVCQPAKQ